MIRKIIWTNYVENKEVLQRANKQKKMNILITLKRKKGNWIGYFFSMNCPLKHIIEKKNRKDGNTMNELLMDNVTEKRSYWEMKQETKRRTLWITRFWRHDGPIVRGTV